MTFRSAHADLKVGATLMAEEKFELEVTPHPSRAVGH